MFFKDGPYPLQKSSLFRDGTGTCESSNAILQVVCGFSVIIHGILTCNVVEALLLYFCLKAIKDQTEESYDLIGPSQYKKRKRYASIINPYI